MKRLEPFSHCACCSLNRRRFLRAGCAACAGATGLLVGTNLVHGAIKSDKIRIQIIYLIQNLVQSSPDWPNVGFDFKPVMAKLEAKLEKECPDFKFITSMARNDKQVQEIIKRGDSEGIDGYLVYHLNNCNRSVRPVAATGKPTLYVDFHYGGSGRFLSDTARLLRAEAPNFGFVSSSDLDDVVAAVKCFKSSEPFSVSTRQVRMNRTPAAGDLTCKPDLVKVLDPKDCVAAMKQGKILAIGRKPGRLWKAIEEQMGFPVVNVSFAELNEAWKAADKDESNEIADRWQKTAKRIEDVSRKTLEQSAAMYLGQKALLKKHHANAVTINCLGGFYGGHLHAYPCLGFHELSNEGLIGACECDVFSTSTMVAMTALTQGRPGFISDPVVDTATRHIIYAHCVASNKFFGPDGSTNPYEILTHSEDRQGAAVRSICPTGYMTTSVKFNALRKEIVFSQGKAVGNSRNDRACRTKLVVEPIGDIEKLFGQWDQWGWHRVTYYGDLKEPVFTLADALGWKVVEEA